MTCEVELGNEPYELLGGRYARKPVWSPDCSRIAYQDEEQAIWTAKPDGSDPVRVTAGYTQDEEDDFQAWSPDGTRLAFSRYRGGFVSHIFVVNTDGTGEFQLTHAIASDWAPSWSPNSRQIVFQRRNRQLSSSTNSRYDEYLVSIDADGRNETPLTRGGLAEHEPQWSPRGDLIAYRSGGDLWVMRPDGSGARPVAVPLPQSPGYSWSPDGLAIALTTLEVVEDETYKSGTRVEKGIAVIHLDRGASAQAVTLTSNLATNSSAVTFASVGDPEWSPDGQSILFERSSHQGGQRRAWITRVPHLVPLPVAGDCRPSLKSGVGFPVKSHVPRLEGKLRVVLLFVDFPDARAQHSTRTESSLGNLDDAEAYLETMSYNKLDIEFVLHHGWLRAPRPVQHYIAEHYITKHDEILSKINQVAVNLADPDIDFSKIDAVITVLPSSHFSAGHAGGSASADENSIGSATINTRVRSSSGGLHEWSRTLIHELIHVLGLPDLYDYEVFERSGGDAETPELPAGYQWHSISVGLMGLSARYPAMSQIDAGPHRAMLGWSRWQLGWLTERQIQCISTPEATVRLGPLSSPHDDVAMAALPASHDAIIVIESRREGSYDPARPSGIDPALADAGVLVYTVDPNVGGGRRPIKFATDDGNGYLERYPLLAVGESLTVSGYTITVVADERSLHTVTIVKSD